MSTGILRSGNYSNVLFKEIEKQQRSNHKRKAAGVLRAVSTATEAKELAEKQLKTAKKNLKRIEKALKKYKKTGDEKHLAKIVG